MVYSWILSLFEFPATVVRVRFVQLAHCRCEEKVEDEEDEGSRNGEGTLVRAGVSEAI